MQELIDKAEVLLEALPFIRRFQGKTFVIKYGGHAMDSPELTASFARDVVLLDLVGINPVIVHGGGPQISALIKRLGLSTRFVRGMRVTDAETMEAVEMVLQKINKQIVSLIAHHGGRAVGLSGKDGNLLASRKLKLSMRAGNGRPGRIDLGQVGEIAEVNPEVLATLEKANFVPVVAPIGCGPDGLSYNINADLAAGKIAAALKADKLILMTDVEGVKDHTGRLISTLAVAQAKSLIARGVVSEGMIPKVECCIDALRAGVGKTHIIDGRVRHAILLEIFTDAGVGTQVVATAAAMSRVANGARSNREA